MPGVETLTLSGEVVKRGKTMPMAMEREAGPIMGITCPCCNTKRAEPASVLSKSININSSRLYLPLNPKKREFRLLTICSGAFENEVRCNLIPVSMDSKPTYAVLSYCRESREERGQICINGQKTSVTKGLELALKYLRKAKTHLVIWADAVCVNQEDIFEKGSQVRMMKDIYSKASNVAVWLGESGKNSDIAMDLIKSVDAIDFEDLDWVADPVEWNAVRTLFQRPCWERLWTVQEVLLAKKATVICGWKQVPIECFVRFKEIESIYRRAPEERLKPLRIGFPCPWSIILSEWHNLKQLIAHDGIPLSQMLTTTGEFKCSIPIDKIFGLLGLCTEIDREVIKVDYRLCIRCLLARVAKYHFIRRESTSPLSVLQTHQADKDPSLPSWVPDYTKNDREWHLLIPEVEDNTPFAAGANNAAWSALGLKSQADTNDSHNSALLRIEDRGRFETLVLSGLIVDVVETTKPAPFTSFYTGPDPDEDAQIKRVRRESMKNGCQEWEQMDRSNSYENDPYEKTCGRYEAFWRTVIADRDCMWKGPPTAEWDFEGSFEAWMGRAPEKAKDELYTRPFSDAAILHCIYRSFVITRNGYLGLGRECTQQGDLVVVLKGGSVPFILREISEGYYQLVGEAYVHGIMDGSFVFDAQREDVREFRIR